MRRDTAIPALAAGLLLAALIAPTATALAAAAATTGTTTYLVVLQEGVTGSAASALVEAAGGSVVSDLTGQIGVVVATSSVPAFDAALRAPSLVVDAGENLRFQGVPGGGPQRTADVGEELQWDMRRSGPRRPTPCRRGARVEVGILDSGIDGNHVDLRARTTSTARAA